MMVGTGAQIRLQRQIMTRWISVVMFGVLVGLPAQASAQCIMCRTALATPEGQAMIAGFQQGIAFLIALPFLAVGTIAYLAIRSQRRLMSGAV